MNAYEQTMDDLILRTAFVLQTEGESATPENVAVSLARVMFPHATIAELCKRECELSMRAEQLLSGDLCN